MWQPENNHRTTASCRVPVNFWQTPQELGRGGTRPMIPCHPICQTIPIRLIHGDFNIIIQDAGSPLGSKTERSIRLGFFRTSHRFKTLRARPPMIPSRSLSPTQGCHCVHGTLRCARNCLKRSSHLSVLKFPGTQAPPRLRLGRLLTSSRFKIS